MADEKFCGKDLLLQRDNGTTFETIGGARSNSWTLNNEQVDVTTKGDTPWRQLKEGCGIQSVSTQVSGVFVDEVAFLAVQADAFTNTQREYKIINGHGDEIAGEFQLASFESNGEYNEAQEYSFTLESAGTVIFTPAS